MGWRCWGEDEPSPLQPQGEDKPRPYAPAFAGEGGAAGRLVVGVGLVPTLGQGQALPLRTGGNGFESTNLMRFADFPRNSFACSFPLPSPMVNGRGKRGKPPEAAGVMGEGKSDLYLAQTNSSHRFWAPQVISRGL